MSHYIRLLLVLAICCLPAVVASAQEEGGIMIFRDNDSLVIYVPVEDDPVSLESLEIQAGADPKLHTLIEYPGFEGLDLGAVPLTTCFSLENTSATKPIALPDECKDTQNVLLMQELLVAGNVFWPGKLLIISYNGEQVGLCPPNQASCTIRFPEEILPIEYTDKAALLRRWQIVQSESGETVLTLDDSTFAPDTGSTKSLKIQTHIPCEEGRYQQIQHYWTTLQDWSEREALELWVRGDLIQEAPWWSDFSVAISIINEESDELIWQNTQALNRAEDWMRIRIPLEACDPPVGNPWEAEDCFVIPEWLDTDIQGAPELDTTQIIGLQIKSLTNDGWACGDEDGTEYPDMTIWIDQIVLR